MPIKQSNIYVPGDVPEKPEDLQSFLREELAKIQNSVTAVNDGHNDIQTVVPDRPRDGMRVWADGVHWDPSPTNGAVAQATNKATAVTHNFTSGTITMDPANLAAGGVVAFQLNNSLIGANDFVHVLHDNAGTVGAYTVTAAPAGAGAATITIRNNTAAALGEAIVLRYFVNKQGGSSGTPYQVGYTNGAWSRV